ncbi:hypothetical protein QLQ77_gp42 [Gordonia phage Reyja]|uniref:SsDNA binding protein n=1 Tax=Gordonia phage Reyja TaxID=2571250 RepID=A0A4D6T6U9_9CAUD|nr:hypothetical protein QLQ77_gp42 [Gordonia phage Reyja]QCG77788.1 hypothetical protein SEA_REYJA_42 [Gordonia phage Reyja]
MDAVAAFLRSSTKSATWHNIGDTVAGCVIENPTVSQATDFKTKEPKTWKDGNPIMQLVIRLQTDIRDPEDPDDDGVRSLFVEESTNRKRALVAAIAEAGAKSIEPGAYLECTFYGEGEASAPGLSKPKLYRCKYTPPAPGAEAAAFLGTGGNAAQQPAQQPVTTPDPAAQAAAAQAAQAAAAAAAAAAQQAATVPGPDSPPEGVPAAMWSGMTEDARRAYMQMAGNK